MEFPITATANNPANKLPEWSYKEFEVKDLLHSKIGIATTTGVLTFAILAYVNPPFVQEHGNGSTLQIQKPSVHKIGSLSAICFFIILFVSLR